MTDHAIREALGHNGHDCKVKIKRNGIVERFGSPNPFDRSMDWWQYIGTRDEVVKLIQRQSP